MDARAVVFYAKDLKAKMQLSLSLSCCQRDLIKEGYLTQEAKDALWLTHMLSYCKGLLLGISG